MSTPHRDKRRKPFYREMTVAHIREQKARDYVEVVFLESARFYRLTTKNPKYDEILKRLRAAMAEGRALTIGLASLESDQIEEVQAHRSGASEH